MGSLANCLGKAGSIVAQDDIDTIRGAHDYLRRGGASEQEAAFEAVQAVIEAAQDDHAQLVLDITRLGGQVGEPVIEAGKGVGRKSIYKAAGKFQPPANPAEIGDTVRQYVLAEGAKIKKELVVIFDEAGKVVADGSGRKSSVSIPVESGFDKPGNNLMIHHNHPSDASLSDADIVMLGYSGVQGIYAHTPDGNSFRATLVGPVRSQMVARNSGNYQLSAVTMKKAATGMARIILPMLRNAIRSKAIPYQDAVEAMAHITNLAWERAGVIDYYASRAYGDLLSNPAIKHAIARAASVANLTLIKGGISAHARSSAVSDDRRAQPAVRHITDVGGISGGGEPIAGGQPAEAADDRGRPGDDQAAEVRPAEAAAEAGAEAVGEAPAGEAAGEVRQPGLRYFKQELPVKLPKGKTKRTIADVAQAFDAAHLRKHGRKYYPESEEKDYQRLIRDVSLELDDQLQQENTGQGWYSEDVLKALEMASQIYPTLADTPLHRDVFMTFAGLFSNGNTPEGAFMKSAEAFEAFLKNGEIPVNRAAAAKLRGVKPEMSTFIKEATGKEVTQPKGWSQRSATNEQQLGFVKFIAKREGSVAAGIEWLQEAHPPAEINKAMLDSGLYKEVRFDTVAKREGPPVPGFMAFGPKLGRYTLTLQGIKLEADDAAVIDLWYIRTYRRHIGRLREPPLGKEGVAAEPTDQDRKVILRMTGELSRRYDMPPEDIQAVLWFFEKRLWAAVGVTTSEGTNSSGARKLLEAKGIQAADRQGADGGRGAEPGAEAPLQASPAGRVQAPAAAARPRPGVIREPEAEAALGPAPPFYSTLTRTVEGLQQAKASPAQWMSTIRNTAGIKKEELDAVGLEDWLSKQASPVSKEDLTNFVRSNEIEVEETVLGEAQGRRRQLLAQEEQLNREWDRLLARMNRIAETPLTGRPAQARIEMDRLFNEVEQELKANQAKLAEINAELEGLPQGERTKYAQYTMPGGENYRELLFTLPGNPLDAEAFTEGHFKVPNVLAHVRFNERTDSAGKPVLFIEEIQSDWHQKGRKKGYETTTTKYAAKHKVSGNTGPYFDTAAEAQAWLEDANKHLTDEAKEKMRRDVEVVPIKRAISGGVPDAPFKTSWPELAMKRMVRWAAENGFDRIAWTPGDVQADRFDLSKQVKSIDATHLRSVATKVGDWKLGIRFKGDEGYQTIVVKDEDLADNVGKDLADKIRAQDGGTFSNLDLRIGGEGMRGFYDKMLVDVANKIGKKFGVRVGPIDIPMEVEETDDDIGFISDDDQAPRIKRPQRTPSLKITQEMKESVMKGQPRFQKKGVMKNGVLTFGKKKFTEAQIQSVAKQVGTLAQQILGHRINIELIVNAFTDRPDTAGAYVEGLRTILLNMEASPDIIGTLRHESIHALRNLGVITKPEWAILSRWAKQVMPLEQLRRAYASDKTTYEMTDAEFEEWITEEAIAEAFRQYGGGAFRYDADPVLVRLMDKIYRFLDRMANLWHGLSSAAGGEISLRQAITSFEDAPDIFRRIEMGKMKNRDINSGERPMTLGSREPVRKQLRPAEIRQEQPPLRKPKKVIDIYGDVDAVTASNLNLDYLDTSDKIKEMLAALSEENKHFARQRRGVVSNKQTAALAKDLGMSTEELLSRKTGEAWSAHRIYAARTMMVASADNLDKATTAALENDSSENLAKFQQAFTLHVAIQEQIAGLASEAGRALQQFQMIAKAGKHDYQSIIDAAISKHKWAGNMTGRTAVERLSKAVGDLGKNRGAVSQFTRNAYKATRLDMLREAYINALLTGLSTQVVNFASNQFVALWQIPEAALAASVGMFHKGDKVTWGEVAARTAGLFEGYSEGFRAAWQVMKTAEPTGKFGRQRQVDSARQRAIPGLAGEIIRAPTARGLAAMDELFKAINFHAELRAVSYRQAYVAEGLRGKALKRRLAELKANPSEEMQERAASWAEYQTFQQKLGKRAQGLMTAREAVGAPGWIIIPFLRTPVNLFKYAQERLPIANYGLAEVRADLSGDNGNVARDNAIARMLSGTGLVATTLMLAAAGFITGGGSDDREEKERDKAGGWQEYSFKIGDQYISYKRSDPFGMLLGIVADIYEKQSKFSETEWGELPGMVGWSAYNIVGGKTWARGPSDIIEAFSKGSSDSAIDAVNRWLQNVAGSVIPTIVGQAASVQDPVIRDTRSMLDKFMSRLPTQKEKLPPVRDIFGEEKKYEQIETGLGSAIDFAVNLANPIYHTTDKNDPVVKAMQDVGYAPAKPSKKINKHELTAEQYDEYSELIGKNAKRRLGNIMSTGRNRRTEKFEEAYSEARKFATERMKRKYPDLKRPPPPEPLPEPTLEELEPAQ